MKKRIVCLLLACVMVVGLLAGCGSKEPETTVPAETKAEANAPAETKGETEAPSGEIVDIDFYISGTPITDQERVMEKANAIIEKEIGAHLNIIPLSDYTTMQLMIDTGDDWDMCFTANWLGDYFGNAQKGAFADLTQLLQDVAPNTYSRIPESLWEGMKVDGKIYGFVNYQLWGSSKQVGLRFRKDIAEEVGFDWKSLKKMDILDALNKVETEYLEPAKAAHPDMIGWEAQAGSNLVTQQGGLYFGCESVGSDNTVGWISFDNPETVFNQFASEDFMEYCKIMHRWYEKGYIPADAATSLDTSADRQGAKFLAEAALGWPDDIDFTRSQPGAMSMCSNTDAPAVEVGITDLLMPAAAGPTAAVAINANSENIEKCAQLMELVNTNDELFKLITFGEEGVDYTWDENGDLKYTDGGYFFNYNEWQFAQSYDDNGFDRVPLSKNQAGDEQKASLQVVYEGDKTAMASPLSGFVFDPSKVSTEIANVTAIIDEMLIPLVTGTVDPETVIPQFVERLEAAGASTIIAEKQAQIDAWKAANG